MINYEEFTTVFLGDKTPPTKLMLLKRAATKQFHPNLYTGIGGKQEPLETIEQTAIRELKEESGIQTELIPFAKCVVNGTRPRIIHFFFGIYDFANGIPDCTEGILEAVEINQIYTKNLIPTARQILTEWQQKNFCTSSPWTLTVKEGL